MSATSTPIVSTPLQKEKKPRAPTLPAKFSKFIQFGYWFLKKLNEDSDAPAIDEALFIEKIHLFSNVDQQKDFIQGFFDQAKDVNKDVRLLVKQHTKDIAKAAKADAKASKVIDKPKKERKPRAKKVKDDSPEDAFVNEMVQLANDSNTKTTKEPKEKVVKEAKEKVVKEKVVKEPKEKVVKEPKEKVVKEAKEKVVKEPKEKVVKEAKEKVVTTNIVKENDNNLPNPKPNPKSKSKATKPSHDNDQTQVAILNLNDQQFLVDDDLNVYDFHNHSLLGKFDPNNNTIIESK
jgi:hypothetical protein